MKKHYDKFLHKKEIIEETEDRKHFAWYLINKRTREGVHFHGYQIISNEKRECCNPLIDLNIYDFCALGIEQHAKTPLHKGHTPLKNCPVTNGDCYCDGTSLSAQEQLGHIDPNDASDEDYIWLTLYDFYEDWFSDEEE